MAGEEVPTLAAQRVKHMLRDLADGPFVALVFDGDAMRVYASGLDEDRLRTIESLVEQMTGD